MCRGFLPFPDRWIHLAGTVTSIAIIGTGGVEIRAASGRRRTAADCVE